MADGLLVLNPGVGGDNEDIEVLADAGSPIRQRVQIGGAIRAEIARVQATLPLLTSMGLVVRVAGNRSESATVTSVAQNAASVTLLAADAAARIGASVFNNSTASLFIKSGAVASTIDFSVKVLPGGYWEAPAGYSGQLDGIWDAAGAGAALITAYA